MRACKQGGKVKVPQIGSLRWELFNGGASDACALRQPELDQGRCSRQQGQQGPVGKPVGTPQLQAGQAAEEAAGRERVAGLGSERPPAEAKLQPLQPAPTGAD